MKRCERSGPHEVDEIRCHGSYHIGYGLPKTLDFHRSEYESLVLADRSTQRTAELISYQSVSPVISIRKEVLGSNGLVSIVLEG